MNPRVFISYTHDAPAHSRRVLELAQTLRTSGVDAQIDQFVTNPPAGWPRWMMERVKEADFVVAVCSESYRRRFDGEEPKGVGKGAKWEAALTVQLVYDTESVAKIIPVYFGDSDEVVPLALRGPTRYRLPKQYDELVRHVHMRPAIVPVPLGPVPHLPSSSGTAASARTRAAKPAAGATPQLYLSSLIEATGPDEELLAKALYFARLCGATTTLTAAVESELAAVRLVGGFGTRFPKWANGQSLRSGTIAYYPDGEHLRLGDSWYYPNGSKAQSRQTYKFPNGESVNLGRSFYAPDGTRLGSFRALTDIGPFLRYSVARDRSLEPLARLHDTIPDELKVLFAVELAWRAHTASK